MVVSAQYVLIDSQNNVVQFSRVPFAEIPDGQTQVKPSSWDVKRGCQAVYVPATKAVMCSPEARRIQLRREILICYRERDAAATAATRTGYDFASEIASCDDKIARLKMEHDAL